MAEMLSPRVSPGAVRDPEPRWPALVAVLAVAGLYFALPRSLRPVNSWIVLSVVMVLAAATVVARRSGRHGLNQILGYILTGTLTVATIWSLGLLVAALPAHKEPPIRLLISAAALWISNILIFASWYWRLDGGGPYARDLQPGHVDGAFLFPQMTMTPEARAVAGEQNWSPGFVDYLFLAFNTSTAFSPTDVPVLSRWAKSMMMIQSLISLATIALLAARAVNIL
ncbi:MAG TPA: hypothetical protein VIL86_18280 [Tepidisphaeraceae bacterium]|jgi:hypothetical protein